MEDIFFSGTPLLESVGNMEPNILELKEIIINMIRQAIIPLKAYCAAYEKYVAVSNLNVEAYIR
jgi:dynein heavy chain, axonemal